MTPTLEARLAELLPCDRNFCAAIGECLNCSQRPAILALIRERERGERDRCRITVLEQKGETGVPWTLAVDACARAILALEDRND